MGGVAFVVDHLPLRLHREHADAPRHRGEGRQRFDFLCSVALTKAVRVWAFRGATPIPAARLLGHGGTVSNVCAHNLVVVSFSAADGTIRCWHVESARQLKVVRFGREEQLLAPDLSASGVLDPERRRGPAPGTEAVLFANTSLQVFDEVKGGRGETWVMAWSARKVVFYALTSFSQLFVVASNDLLSVVAMPAMKVAAGEVAAVIVAVARDTIEIFRASSGDLLSVVAPEVCAEELLERQRASRGSASPDASKRRRRRRKKKEPPPEMSALERQAKLVEKIIRQVARERERYTHKPKARAEKETGPKRNLVKVIQSCIGVGGGTKVGIGWDDGTAALLDLETGAALAVLDDPGEGGGPVEGWIVAAEVSC